MVQETFVQSAGPTQGPAGVALSGMLAEALEPIFIVSQRSSRIVYASEGAIRLTGYTREELMLRTPLELQAGVTVADAMTRIAPLLSGDREVVRFETVYKRKDGSEIGVEHQVQLLRSQEPPALLVFARLLSEARPDNAQFDGASLSFHRMVEEAAAGICHGDADGHVRFVNPKMARMLGYSVEEMQGANFKMFLGQSQEREIAPRIERRRRGISDQYEAPLRRKDGSELWVLMEASPVFSDDGSYYGWLGIVADITEQKAAEKALVAHETELEERLTRAEAQLAVQVRSQPSGSDLLPSPRLVESAARHFGVLADPSRLRILNELLVGGEVSVNTLAANLGMLQSNVSKHLRLLAGAGMIERRRSGTTILCSLSDRSVITLCEIVRSTLEQRARENLDALTP